MAILMLIQQKFSMATTSGGSPEQEKMMLVIFPLMFGLIFYRMPSGLVLYWLVNSALMIFFQLKMAGRK
jgi:YidC/Oxa1 family membrane protein insertase